jgi:hypothetical protein
VNINLIQRNGDERWPIKWDTDKPLQGPTGSHYEFVGTDTLDGGLTVTLRFKDVHDLDTFADTARTVFNDNRLSPRELARWDRFMESLVVAIDAAPHTVEYGKSYHADIDARRIQSEEL